MSADVSPRAELPPAWERLERAVREATLALGYWRRRAEEAEEEVAHLRAALETLVNDPAAGADDGGSDEATRLRAENAALRSRMAQAQKRVQTILVWLGALEARR